MNIASEKHMQTESERVIQSWVRNYASTQLGVDLIVCKCLYRCVPYMGTIQYMCRVRCSTYKYMKYV